MVPCEGPDDKTLVRKTLSDRDWCVAFAGDADIDERNLAALLDDWLPTDAGITAIMPEKIGRSQKGLKKVAAWLEEQNIIPEYTDIGTALDQRPGPYTQAYLVLLWGEDGDDKARELFEQAHEAKIPVKDLTGALDALVYEDEKAAAEPVPEPEPPKRRRRGTAATETPARPAASRTARSRKPEDDISGYAATLQGLNRAVPDGGPADEAQAMVIPPRMSTPAEAVVTDAAEQGKWGTGYIQATYGKPQTGRITLEDIIRGIIREELQMAGVNVERGDEPKIVTKEATLTYLVDDDGNYRFKGSRVRIKKNETEVELTEAQAAELREAGHLS